MDQTVRRGEKVVVLLLPGIDRGRQRRSIGTIKDQVVGGDSLHCPAQSLE